MTRFARAKGSKASNEKLPEQATSWSEMKQEMLKKYKELADKKEREVALKKRQANYQAFLQEQEEVQEKKIAWADFPEAKNLGNKTKTPKKRKVNESNENRLSKANSRKLEAKIIDLNEDDDSEDSDGQFSALKLQIEKVLAKENGNDSDSDDAPPEEVSIKDKPQEIVVKKVKNPKHKLKIVLDKEQQLNKDLESSPKKMKPTQDSKERVLNGRDKRLIEKKLKRKKKQNEKKILKKQEGIEKEQAGEQEATDPEKLKLQKKLERRKRQKEKKKLKSVANNIKVKGEKNLKEEEVKKIEKKKEKAARQAEKRRKFREEKALAAEKGEETFNGTKTETKRDHGFEDNRNTIPNNKLNEEKHINKDFTERKPFQKLQKNQTQKKAKQRDNKQHPSRKQKPEKMIINGKTIEIDYVDGFPVKKEDAERLKKLRKEMISKGLPRSEINTALKLERRRAEKAFAREKKNVCFNCRKSGHNLSECPDLGKDQVAQTAGTGICFKCGSTEHTHFECKVVKGLDYKFATCFICKEQGHIAKQCPDNQRGLYPKGGACKVCGDVTHLKKDCPKYQAQQAQLQSSISIETMDNRNPDDLGSKAPGSSFAGTGKRMNKVIKF